MKILFATTTKVNHFNILYDHLSKNHEIVVIGGKSTYKSKNDLIIYKIDRLRLISGILGKIGQKVSNWYLQRWLKRILAKEKPDVVHIVNCSGIVSNQFGDITIPIIVTPVGSDVYREPWESTTAYENVKQLLEKADIIHTNAIHLREFIIENFGIPKEKCRVEFWGINPNLYDPVTINKKREQEIRLQYGLKKEDIIILYPKSFRNFEKQNYFRLLQAFVKVAQKHERVKLVMLAGGRKNHYTELMNEINVHELNDRVVIIDEFQPESVMKLLYFISDIVTVIPDTDQLSAAILECMLFECIPILSDIPAYRYYFEDKKNCFYVDPKRQDGLVEVLELCLGDLENHKKKFARENIPLVYEKFDSRIQMPKVEKIYIDLRNNAYEYQNS